MDDAQNDRTGAWSWQARSWMPKARASDRIISKQEFAPGIWAEWQGADANVGVQKRAVDAGVLSATSLVVRATEISKYLRIFFGLGGFKAESVGVSFSLVARTLDKPINGRMRVVWHSAEKGWHPASDHAVSVPFSKLWTCAEGVLPVTDLRSRAALMWECNSDEISLCFAAISVAGAAFSGPSISVRPAQVSD